MSDETVQKIEKADAMAAALTSKFTHELDTLSQDSYHEAASKLISNHEAVVKDCTRSVETVLSQKNLKRAEGHSDAADVALRVVADALVRQSTVVSLPAEWDDKREERVAAAAALRVVAQRLCVPRDMGAEGARCLRGVLTLAAEELEGGYVEESVEEGAEAVPAVV